MTPSPTLKRFNILLMAARGGVDQSASARFSAAAGCFNKVA